MDRTNLLLGLLTQGRWRSRVPSRTRRTTPKGSPAFRIGSGALQDGSFGNEAGLEVAPERDRQLARHGDDGDAPHASLLVADALAEPLGERAVGLMPPPQPRQLDHRFARPAVAGFGDPLVARHVAALERGRRQSDVLPDAAPIPERSIVDLAAEHRAEMHADAFELEKLDDLALDPVRRRRGRVRLGLSGRDDGRRHLRFNLGDVGGQCGQAPAFADELRPQLRRNRKLRQTLQPIRRRRVEIANPLGEQPAAEDALADAFATALAVWPVKGAPANPEGWLATAARRRLIDGARRRRTAEASAEALQLIGDELVAAEGEASIPDRRLALMFACAHPAIEESIRAPLMLQTILGLDAKAIGSAFLVSPAAMGQRLARAKTKIRLAGVPFRVPDREDLPERLSAVLEAIYAAFAHGWAEAYSDDPRGRDLAEEAIWLGRVVAELAPREPEAKGLLALMLYAHSRRAARRNSAGRYAPLSEQPVELWDEAAIEEAESLLSAASKANAPGRFQLEAAVQSVHAARRRTGETDWQAIARLYDALYAMTGSPVIAVNRAIAVAETKGASAGLALLEALGASAALADFEAYWVAKADLFRRLGESGEARRAYEIAIGLQSDPAARAFLMERLAALP